MATIVAKGQACEEDLDEGWGTCDVALSLSGFMPNAFRACDVPDVTHGWLWEGRIPSRNVTVIVGPKGSGKSYLVAEIAARVSNGDPWPDDPLTRHEPGTALIFTAQDETATVIKPRLRACRADLAKVKVIDLMRADGRPAEITLKFIEAAAETSMPGLKLIVIDPFANVLGTRNDRRRDEIGVLLNQLTRLAENRGIAIILVNATDKSSAGKRGQYGVDVVPVLQAGAPAVWTLEQDPATDDRFFWLSSRMNLGPRPKGLAFAVNGVPGTVVWDPEPVELNGTDLQPVNRPITKVARAGDWLSSYLEEGGCRASEVIGAAALAGISRGALYEAKGRLGVVSAKGTDQANAGWRWRLSGVVEARRGSTLDPEFLTRFAAALRAGCEVEGPASDDRVEKTAIGVVGVVSSEKCGDLFKDLEDSGACERVGGTVERSE